MRGSTSVGYDQFETSPEAIEQELRPAVCERRPTDRLKANYSIDMRHSKHWSGEWLMRFNASKCKVMYIGRQTPHRNYTMGAITLATTTSEKDLGVSVDTAVDFQETSRL